MNVDNIKKHQKFSKDSFQKSFIFSDDQSKTFVLSLLPGQNIPAHTHGKYTLQVLVFKGRGKVQVNDEERLVQEGDIVRCDGKDNFSLRNCSEDTMTCLAILL